MSRRSQFDTLVLMLIGLAAAACGGQTQTATPTQPTPPPTTPAVTLSSVIVGVAGNAPATIAPGEKLQLFAQAVYSDNSKSDVTNLAVWQSSDPIVATVSNGGVLTAAVEGALDVSATFQGRSGSLHADVQKLGCRASLSPSALTFSAFGTSASVQVTMTESACRWTATSDASWLPFTYDPKRSGDGSFAYYVPGNSTTEPRTAKIVVSVVGGPSSIHTVQQERPLGCSYVVEPAKITFPNSGGAGGFDVITSPADCQWTVYNGASYGPIQLTGPTSGTGAARVTYTAQANLYSSDNNYTIEIRGLSGMNPPGVHKVVVVKK
jgi:hypothetical protein